MFQVSLSEATSRVPRRRETGSGSSGSGSSGGGLRRFGVVLAAALLPVVSTAVPGRAAATRPLPPPT
ncbi:hypothetical protein ACH4S9_23860 [Streptomyces sp. NPDC021225]|uniref:hypothetical protein n=1 Tax=Streptomyces sp. NPDC021225 TaxID=3365121 RepID=UPI0037A09677